MTSASPPSPAGQKRSAGRPKDLAKRDAMLDAAACLFLRNGPDAVTMEAVAKEAGVSKVTVYGHFDTKEALFGSVIRRETASIRQGLEQLPDTHDGVRQSLIQVGISMVRFLMEPHVLAVERVMSNQGEQHPRLLQAFFEAGPWAMSQWLQEKLEGLASAGHLSLPAPAQAADQLCSMWQGMLIKEVRMGVRLPPSEDELKRQITGAVDVFLAAYGKR
ncbi:MULTISPECIES: TetR/AcrR family transcriptional regulator [Halomonadaceae]|uniref:Transcriptional regulator n=1 Tax=Vreelandella hamiltonii TaxID=502829 RepID=A0A8H9I717_9GAMM|nr:MULTISPECIES: TetR/AcrR family transcriptional regulator [Halomonas]ATH77461.1 TetR/AcrR family transcriptional regulator [Halomonas hydrothermalis]KHJ52696.1 TetR family transcriptional regulator [Halomonas hydrothermalis]UDM06970.1 TetR/AcrR family transcriptional regulator [Halomonas sp. NyZ770]GGW35417.1 transcriptional regulator [Halomonas hamiltonii]